MENSGGTLAGGAEDMYKYGLYPNVPDRSLNDDTVTDSDTDFSFCVSNASVSDGRAGNENNRWNELVTAKVSSLEHEVMDENVLRCGNRTHEVLPSLQSIATEPVSGTEGAKRLPLPIPVGPIYESIPIAVPSGCIDIPASSLNDELHVPPAPNAILMLNDDCLECICKQLAFLDQLRFGQVCDRFRSVYQMLCRPKFKKVSIENIANLSAHELEVFFSLAGEYITCIKGSIPEVMVATITNLMNRYCTKLDFIDFYHSDVRSHILPKMLENARSITKLNLRTCALSDSDILPIKMLQNLEQLSLVDNFMLTGKYLWELSVTLKTLELQFTGLENRHFVDLCKSLKNIRKLNIFHCRQINSEGIQAMADYCEKLESLEVNVFVDVEIKPIARLPNLRKLSLDFERGKALPSELFLYLTQHKAYKLEFLSCFYADFLWFHDLYMLSNFTQLKQLYFVECSIDNYGLEMLGDLVNLQELFVEYTAFLTDSGLVNFLKKSAKISFMSVDGCQNITDAAIFEIMEHFEKQPTKRDRPLLIFALGTCINYEIYNDPRYIAGRKYIEVFF